MKNVHIKAKDIEYQSTCKINVISNDISNYVLTVNINLINETTDKTVYDIQGFFHADLDTMTDENWTVF